MGNEMDKQAFMDLLSNMVEQAAINDNRLTKAEIEENLEDFPLDAGQMRSVYEYLAANGVSVEGVNGVKVKKAEDASNNDQESEGEKEEKIPDSQFVKMYLKELKEFGRLKEEEELNMLSEMLSASEAAFDSIKENYINHKLHFVVDKARRLSLGGELLEELIGEGNIGLLTAFSEIKDTASAMKEHVEECITDAMNRFIDDIYASDSEEKAMIAKVNFISEAAKKLKEENGEEPSISEMAKYTNLDEDEILSIINLSADNLKADK